MNENLQEFVDCRGVAVRVDAQQGVIRGVKILGLESRNGRSYPAEALAEAAGLYEGAKVNVNHPKGSPLAARDYQDRIGVIRNASVRPDEGLFADFHFNPKHALAEQLLWDAEHAPENVGFSHNVEARTARRGDRVVVEAITRVQSVDLVADPATTRGLFEAEAGVSLAQANGSGDGAGTLRMSELTVDALTEHRPDLIETLREEQRSELARLREEVARLRAAEAQHEKQQLIRRVLAEFGLPNIDSAEGRAKSVLSTCFLESLQSAPDETAVRELVRDRARLVHRLGGIGPEAGSDGTRPLCRDQNPAGLSGPADTNRFVESITSP